MSDSLSISLVIYHPDENLLEETLSSLFLAAKKAQAANLIDDFYLTIIDNSMLVSEGSVHRCLAKDTWEGRVNLIKTSQNLGYGSGHNVAIRARCDNYHLVINPDVRVDEDALIESIRYLQQYPQVGLVTPLCYSPDGQQEYLCKAYPSVGVLLLRGFAPKFLKNCFKTKLAEYELSAQDNINRNDVLIASGCFMFFRQQALKSVNGFCAEFFLYFEDFDLSLRLLAQWQIAFVTSVKIIHHGGRSAKKGLKHIKLFVHSASLFFSRHGWRFW